MASTPHTQQQVDPRTAGLREQSPVLEEQLRLAASTGGARVRLLRAGLLGSDIVAACVAAAVAAATAGIAVAPALAFIAIVAVTWVCVSYIAGLYYVEGLSHWATGFPELGRQTGLALLLSWPIYGAAWALDADNPIVAPLAAATMMLLLGPGLRGVTRALLHRMSPLKQRTIILGSGVVAGQIIERITRHGEFGLRPIGLLDDDPHRASDIDIPVLGTLRDLRVIIETHAVERVIIAFSRASHEDLLDCLRACRDKRVAVDVVPRLFEFLGGARSLEQIGDVPLLSMGVPRLSQGSRAVKRILDISLATFGLILLTPLWLLIAIAIKLESRGPVFFRQLRVGRNGRPFRLVKFRSMYADAEQRKAEVAALNDHDEGFMFKIHRDPRISRVGQVLRRLSLDELPQLFNVLKGEMSLVGPRPLIVPEHDALAENWHTRRLDLRPGLTGPWQIAGRSNLTSHEMLRLDFQYVTGWSLARDIEIMLATLPAVFSGRGAY